LGKSLKVLINGLHAKSGGGVTYLRNMLPFFSADPSIEAHLCIHESQADIIGDVPDGIFIHHMNFRSGFWRLALYEQILVTRLARNIAADVTFSPANYGPLLAPNQVILLRNSLGVAFVEKRLSKIAYWVIIYAATVLSILSSRRVIAVSDFITHTVGKPLAWMFAGKCAVVHHGVGDIFSPPQTDKQRDDTLLAVSDIYVQKNFQNLLLAMALLKKKHPHILLQIAGRQLDDGYYQALQRIITEQGLENNVSFLGSVSPEELAILYRRCRLFVFPSFVESFGNPLVEAMASGLPVATSNAAAMPEIVGPAALLFDPTDVNNMADTIERLYMDRELCREMGEKSLAQAKQYSWKKTAERTLDIIRQASPES
jgi:glycosyltransferase involved in cell wall biosynthesis